MSDVIFGSFGISLVKVSRMTIGRFEDSNSTADNDDTINRLITIIRFFTDFLLYYQYKFNVIRENKKNIKKFPKV